MIGSSGATIQAMHADQPHLFTISQGAPPVYISNLRLRGTLRMRGGSLIIMDCSIEAITGGALSSERALSILGGSVVLLQSALHGHLGGAIEVVAAHPSLITCSVRDSQAESGGAMLVGNDAVADVELAHFVNSARSSGGALQAAAVQHLSMSRILDSCTHRSKVNNRTVHLLNRTFFEHNSAESNVGGSIHLLSPGFIDYRLPAPPGRWLFMCQGLAHKNHQRRQTERQSMDLADRTVIRPCGCQCRHKAMYDS
eukprot:2306241-Prymnesium_polylepis.2